MSNPYYQAPPPRRPGQRDEYRRGDAPYQIPWWVLLICFCLGMWPVSLVLLGVNYLLRTGRLDSSSFRTKRGGPARASAYVPPAQQAPRPAPQARPGQYPPPPPTQDVSSRPAQAPAYAAPGPVPQKADGDGKANIMLGFGIALAAVGILATVSGVHDLIFYGGWEYWHLYVEDVVAGMLPLFSGVGLCMGAHILKTRRRMSKKIDNIVGDADHMYISDIAAAIPCGYDKCCRHLERCIDKGVFGDDAYLDMRTRCLVVRGTVPRPAQPQKPADAPSKDVPQTEYQKSLARLRALNEAIPDEEMSAKIARLEAVSAKIFAQAESDPEKLPQMRKFLDYYLPTSLKLLESYAELDAQGIEGENIAEAKRRIEQAMDTLVTAFENQLDQLFRSDALDVTTDIDVMERMLRADGLAGDDPFAGLRAPKAPEAPTLEL